MEHPIHPYGLESISGSHFSINHDHSQLIIESFPMCLSGKVFKYMYLIMALLPKYKYDFVHDILSFIVNYLLLILFKSI